MKVSDNRFYDYLIQKVTAPENLRNDQKFEKNFPRKPIINMTSWMRNQLTKLYNAVSAPVTATRDALAERLQGVRETASLLYNRMMENMGYGQERLKDIVEKEAEEEQQQEEDIDLTPHEHERALKGAYRSFVIPGTPKTDIDSYFDQTKPHIKTLIKNQLKEMGSAKIIMTLWVRWKKPIVPLIDLDPEEFEDAQDIEFEPTDP